MFKSLSLIFIALFVQGSLAQIEIEGTCPEVQIVKDFDFSKYDGEWWGYAKYDFEVNSNLKCNRAVYTDKGNLNFVVDNIGVTKDTNVKEKVQWPGRIITTGRLAIWYDSKQCLGYPNYNIVGTDYNHWAAVHNCRQINETYTAQTAWLLTREQVPRSSAVKAAKAAFTASNVDVNYLVRNDQSDCPKKQDKKAKFSLFGFLG